MTTPPLMFCVECAHPVYELRGNNQKYCEDCGEDMRRENIRLRVEAYRRRWRHLYGRSNHKESLGSGFITSCTPKPEFDRELEIVERELRRLGLR